MKIFCWIDKMRKLMRRLIVIVIAVTIVLIFHEIIPKPERYLAGFIAGMILGYYIGMRNDT